MLDNIQAMSYSDWACFQGDLDISVLMIPGITSMIALLDPLLRVIHQYFISNFIVFLKRTSFFLFLDKIYPNN